MRIWFLNQDEIPLEEFLLSGEWGSTFETMRSGWPERMGMPTMTGMVETGRMTNQQQKQREEQESSSRNCITG